MKISNQCFLFVLHFSLIESSQVPTCSIVGDKDVTLGTAATSKFQQMPNHEIHILKDARHQCYIDQPEIYVYIYPESV